MNKKTIIQLVVIGACFIGAGLVLYNGLFKNDDSISPGLVGELGGIIGEVEISAAPGEQILPHGNNLDFGILEQNNQEYGIIEFPKLNPVLEVGIPENELVLPPPKAAGEGE